MGDGAPVFPKKTCAVEPRGGVFNREKFWCEAKCLIPKVRNFQIVSSTVVNKALVNKARCNLQLSKRGLNRTVQPHHKVCIFLPRPRCCLKTCKSQSLIPPSPSVAGRVVAAESRPGVYSFVQVFLFSGLMLQNCLFCCFFRSSQPLSNGNQFNRGSITRCV